MKAYNERDLEEYLKDDVIARQLARYPDDAAFPSHRWLLEMPAKRMIYQDVYGPLLASRGLSVLDVGGGFCGLTRELVERHEYALLEMPDQRLRAVQAAKPFYTEADWRAFAPRGTFDLIIANDIFPNVDQGLEAFLAKFRPIAKRMILTLTAYDTDRFYVAKRIDAEEILVVKPWDSGMLFFALERAGVHVEPPAYEGTEQMLFPNKRTVYKLELP